MFPQVRLRRNRRTEWSRRLNREVVLTVDDLIWTIFIREEQGEEKIASMPGVSRYTLSQLDSVIGHALELGIPAVALFPFTPPYLKTEDAKEAFNPQNLICQAIRVIKEKHPQIGVITDVALDPYTSHGHDGLIVNDEVNNDLTLEVLCQQALNQARAGADVLAPSDMMDGRVGAIRSALDSHGFNHIQILAYSVKYASSFYGPFREAVGSQANLGKASKKTYQMDPGNSYEALREIELDIAEGADMIMVKPGLPYLDILKRVKEHFGMPTYVYQVSGEYSMIKAASLNGWVDGEQAMYEALLGMKRAGANGILTYAALEIAEFLNRKDKK